MGKKTIGIVCGGFSGEREISLQSAKNVKAYLSPKLYRIFEIRISKNEWVCTDDDGAIWHLDKSQFSISSANENLTFDCLINMIHGSPGEDGLLQGYLDILEIPYTSSKLITMSITFNKVICKMVLKNHGIKTAQYHLIKKNHPYNREAIIKQLGLPLFVKPNKGGSSFGASKVETIEDFHPAIEKCFAVDDEALVEEFLKGREITCGVLKLKNKVQSVGITEIVSNASFFDFDQKYSENGAQEITPAPISPEKYDECLKLSAFIYQDLACLGIARIDYILVKDQLYFVEVNTIPGLTSRSLIPQQAQHSGINLSEVFDQMIQDTME